MRWYEQDEINQDENEQDEVDGMNEEAYLFHRWGDAYLNKKAVLPQGNREMPQVFFSVEVRQQHCLQV